MKKFQFFSLSTVDCLKKLGIEPSEKNIKILEGSIDSSKFMYQGHNVALGMDLEKEFWERVIKIFFPKIFSFDAETNGLWGQAFSIAAIVYDNGVEITRFIGRCPIEGEINSWIAENVLPKMENISVSHDSYDELLKAFAEFYLANKTDANIIVHMGVPVESSLLKDMHSRGYIGDWDGPCPLIDIAGNLQQSGEDPTSCDKYVAKYGLKVSENNTHNPLYDSEVAAVVFQHLLGRNK